MIINTVLGPTVRIRRTYRFSNFIVAPAVKADTWQLKQGIDVSLINDNLYEWSAKINGPAGTPWEGGVFRVYLKFDEHYNAKPPRICFHTIPYHPNIDMITGRPCIDFIDSCEKWKGNIKVSSILLQIQNMLGNPILDEAINAEAASMCINSNEAYNKIVHECVEYSKQIESGQYSTVSNRQYSLQNIAGEMKTTEAPPGQIKPKKATKLSFDDYLSQWSGLATTKPVSDSFNTYIDSIGDEEWQRRIHYGMTEDELLEEELNKRQEQDNLYYGSLQLPKKPQSRERGGRDSKLARINQMRKIYLPKKPLPTPRSPNRPHSDSEGEVDNLVAWTQNLNADDLDTL